MNKKYKEIKPSPLAEKLLLWFLKEDLAEEVLGDLDEKFYSLLENQSARKAKMNYWFQVINYLRPFAVKQFKLFKLNPFFMFKHNFKLATRNIKKHKSSFLINLVGLSTGLACVILIGLWVMDEWNFDKNFEDGDQIYRVLANHQIGDGYSTQVHTPDLLAETLAEEIPEIEYGTPFTPAHFFKTSKISIPGKKITAAGSFVGENFFQIFSHKLIYGNKDEVLKDKSSIVISEQLAHNVFGGVEEAIGKSVEWDMVDFKVQLQVSGVFQNVSSNNSDQFDYVFPIANFHTVVPDRPVHWDNHFPSTYFKAKKGTDIASLDSKVKQFIKEKLPEGGYQLFVVPYSDYYLHGTYENGKQAGGRIDYLMLFSLIAFFVLIIACINFMNLSTAKATRRMKEIGVQKAIGADRSSLISQYLSESMLISLLSLSVALTIVAIALPYFNQITNKEIAVSLSWQLIAALFSITLITGLISGSYPALYLSSFKPADIFKGKMNRSLGALWARKGLVIFQFSLSIILIISVLIVYQQISFIQNKNLGYEKDNIIHFPIEGKIAENKESFISQIKQLNGVKGGAFSFTNLMGSQSTTMGLTWDGKNPEEPVRFENCGIGLGFIELMNIEVLEGRAFSENFAEDSTLIMNQTAINAMGLKDPIGKTVNLWGQDQMIIGVVKDFHFESLHEKVNPLFFRYNPEQALTMNVKLEKGKEKEAIANLSAFYTTYNPGYSFNFKFMDTAYQEQYNSEKRIATLSKYFAGFAILISCLGLFGLTAFSIERRMKEIGVRKILGSSNFGILKLLSGEFTKIIIISILIAIPVSYLIAQNWLQQYAFSIDLSIGFFLAGAIGAIAMTWFTISLQTARIYAINPKDCLTD